MEIGRSLRNGFAVADGNADTGTDGNADTVANGNADTVADGNAWCQCMEGRGCV